MTTPATLDAVRDVLRDVLSLGARADSFDRSTPLFGELPELDSMAVTTVILELEERFGIVVEGDDLDADTFATLGSLSDFVESKRSSTDSSTGGHPDATTGSVTSSE